jgi:hypothetical protein
MLTIVIFYHHSGSKYFRYYYQDRVQAQLSIYFPILISYEYFVTRMPRLLPGLFLLPKWLCAQNQRTDHYIIDSKPLAIRG